MSDKLSISVIVPTYQRVQDLARCLSAIEQQDRAPTEVIVVCRVSDLETQEFLSGLPTSLALSVLRVAAPGVVAALNLGLSCARSDIVAFTDDDAAPRRDWLARVEQHYEGNPGVGGVGGRDHVHECSATSEAVVVGKIQWFGRTIGRHHVGVGPARNVEFFKGVNMTYRRIAVGTVRFDERLLGAGAQVCNDMAFSLSIRRRGWNLIYDPAVAVDHYPGDRFDEDGRRERSVKAVADGAFNETLSLLEHLPFFRRLVFWIWAIGVGKRDSPGLLQCLRLAPLKRRTWREFLAVTSGRIAASRVARR